MPLLNIPLDHVVADELHIRFRITDVLLNNLIQLMVEKDKRQQFKGKKMDSQSLNAFVQCVRQCGVTFDVWQKVNADSSQSGLYDFTSLMGDDKKKILQKLAQILFSVFE